MLFAIAVYFAFEGVHEVQEGLEALKIPFSIVKYLNDGS